MPKLGRPLASSRRRPGLDSRGITESDRLGGLGGSLVRAERRIFTCVGFMAGSLVCVQIARLRRARGLACLRIAPCEHFPQEDPSGTAGRPGSSPPAPATHSAGADHPACRNPQAEHRCSGNWTLWLCRRLGGYWRPGRRPRSRADPRRPPRRRAAEGAQHGGLASVRGRHRTPRSSSGPAIRRPAGPGPPPAAPVTSTSPLTRALLGVPPASSPATL
jgi:hypothetical protein